ncbi:MAG: AAA family ATPase, partial [Dolichospermum sp.]|nr:AAA family ATPase [Dolichospermum sp.]
MLIIPGYQNLLLIYESANSLVYRAKRTTDNQSVILKLLQESYPTPEELVRYKQEYEITHNLNITGICRSLSLEKYQNRLIIIFDDFGGESLRKWIENRTFNLKEFLQIAIGTTDSLIQIHRENIIHKDINPANIVYNFHTQEIKIIDFGISTLLTKENPILKNPHVLEGTLAYISPEQTGRMNRSLDYRTDFYSLGVTFYELLTNQLPFATTDALELVHWHIAKQPLSASQINPEIPQVVSDIILKLMAKTAEERYQSAVGIKADLEKCLNQLQSNGSIANFSISHQDISDKFQIPQKLYGREKEIGTLLNTFERVSVNSSELMLINGYSGIGKSALVQELYKPITQKRGYFISGKFDQYQRNIPYSAIVNAFQQLIKQLLAEPEAQLQKWQKQILKSVGINGQILIDVIPELELIIGKQSGITEVSGNESQNRFKLVFQNFIQVFTKPEHPLVIFLDDLQWADSASLKLMELLMSSSSQGLFLIGACRDNEVSAVHPLILTLEEIASNEKIINSIYLLPLTLNTTRKIISDTLKCPEEQIKELADLVQLKTEGNPFFINEFLKSLYTENLLEFNFDSLHWQWDLEKINSRGFSDNVVELMSGKIQKLPENTQQILKLAACIGNQFDLNTLSLIIEKPLREIIDNLESAINYSLIIPLGSNEEIELAILDPESENYQLPEYKFVHDRIQQAAYSLIPEQERNITHYQIGKLLLQQTASTAIDEQIFRVVNQLNYGIELINNQIERDELAQLNLFAAHKARNATAYQAAKDYAQIGLNSLENRDSAWQRQYEMTLKLHEIAVELASLCGEFEQMNGWFNAVIDHAETALERVSVYIVKIHSLVAQNKFFEAISIGQSILKQLGVDIPDHPSEQHIQEVIKSINILMENHSIEELIHLPNMVDTEKLAIMQVAASICPVCIIVASPLLPLVIVLQVSLSIQYGNSSTSAFGYASYGTFLNIFTEDVTIADSFSRLAYQMVSAADGKNVRSATYAMIGFYLHHRKSHLRLMLAINQAGYQAGLETGQLDYVGYNGHGFCLNSFWCGQPLTELEKQIRAYRQQLLDFQQLTTANYCSLLWETTLFLLGNPEKINISFQQSGDEEQLVSQSLAAKDIYRIFAFYLYRAILQFLMGDIIQASADAVQARQYILGILAGIIEAGLYFYDSLITLAIVPSSLDEVDKQQQTVKENQSKLQFWAEHAPMNYLHKWQLVEAEKCRVLGEKLAAIDYYDQAIAGAKDNGYIQEVALACELAAKFYLSQKKELSARAYMQEARYYYQRWGAKVKVKQLENQYPQLLTATQGSVSKNTTLVGVTSSGSNTNLDIASIIKASQAISGEIMLDKLLSSLMKILIENAGAQTGFLILEHQGRFLIEAEGQIDIDQVIVLQSLPLENSNKFSVSIIRYVVRTQETIVLNNATKEGQFTNDYYVQNHQPQSILCIPLINQGKLISIVYLENNLTTGAFTEERVQIIKLLSGQAAIAIENARFYQKMAELNKAYERFVPRQFLQFLQKESIIDVRLGDQVQLEMSVLFSDIRDFTRMSEKMTPEENFKFINAYLSRMESAIIENQGFIDKYIGDAIMALFSGEADDAVQAGIAMLNRLNLYNQERINYGLEPIRNGIGINTGLLMLGTVGGNNRMDGTVISDAVNLASRIEGLTKEYGVSLLISQQTFQRLQKPENYAIRQVDKVKVKGKLETVTIYEVFDADTPDIK